MSAIVAVAALAPDAADEAWLKQATARSSSAGPDGQESRFEGACGMGHALLRTGPSDERQPLTLNGRVWLTADVRLDARRDLVAGLRAAGAQASASCSDAELVLHAYTTWGERFLERVAGDFALALWDGDARRLLCARDQLGVAPLHYVRDGDRLLVATGIDALLLHPRVDDDLDEAAIADFLSFGFHLDRSASTFAAVRRLPPAHVLTWSAGTVRVRRYWQLAEWDALAQFSRLEDCVERFRELLDAAVEDRLTADRATLQLSGGMDSTSVAASAVHVQGARGAARGDLRAITGVLGGDSGDDEGEFAALVAEQLGLPLDIVDASRMQPVDPFSEPALATPEPTAYRFTDFELQYARLPARHASVALSGHGGDALLAFVPWYWLEWLARGQLLRVSRAFADQMRLHRGRPRTHARRILRARSEWRLGLASIPPWLAADYAARSGVAERSRERTRVLLPPRVRALDTRSLASEPLWPALFGLGDPSVTTEAVRFRYPLIDLRLVYFARSLAPEPWLVDKRILRAAGEGRLPEPVQRRRKTPLIFGAEPGVSHETTRRLAELIQRCPGLDRFVDRAVLTAAVGDATMGDPRLRRQLRHGLGFAHWLWHRDRCRTKTPLPHSR